MTVYVLFECFLVSGDKMLGVFELAEAAEDAWIEHIGGGAFVDLYSDGDHRVVGMVVGKLCA